MENLTQNITAIISVITAIVGALASAYFAIKSAIQKNRAEEAEKDKNTVTNKLDLIPIISKAVLASEKEFDGYNKGCNKCGKGEHCSQYQHSRSKLEFALEIVMNYCKEKSIDFRYDYVKSKIEELVLTAKQFTVK